MFGHIGTSAGESTLATIEMNLNMTLIDGLEAAAAEGLVIHDETYYTFAHDRIQEAAYGMIEDTEKSLYHKKFGLALISWSLATGDLSMLFAAVNQINRSGPSLWSNTLRVEVSKYNLMAGKRSMEFSDFSTAFHYFDEGMTYLPKHHWRGAS